MKKTVSFGWLLLACAAFPGSRNVNAADTDPNPPAIATATVTSNGQKRLSWTPYPAAAQYQVLTKTNLGLPFAADLDGAIAGYTWSASNATAASFHRVQVTPLSS